MTLRPAAVVTLLVVAAGLQPLHAQDRFSGRVTVAASTFPDEDRDPELRGRLYARSTLDAGRRVRFELGGFTEGLVGRWGDGTVDDAIAEVDQASVEITLPRLNLLVGFTRSVWGRLDEVQPSDVVNPLDMSKFFFDNRSTARMAVGLARARLALGEAASLELIAVPRFRKGRFDRLDEPTSPFTPDALSGGAAPPVNAPAGDLGDQMQGGARVSATIGRVDWAIGGYRGFRPTPVYTLSYGFTELPEPPVPIPQVTGAYPRFTMATADFETVIGRWGLRGEAVVAEDDAVQARQAPVSARSRSVQAGLGADRAVAGYRLLAQVLWRDARLESPSLPVDPLTNAAPTFDTRSWSTMASVERRYAQETRLLRVFALYDATSRNGLLRGLGAVSLRDGLWLEGAVGWLSGRRRGFLGPFVDSDFVSIRLTQDF